MWLLRSKLKTSLASRVKPEHKSSRLDEASSHRNPHGNRKQPFHRRFDQASALNLPEGAGFLWRAQVFLCREVEWLRVQLSLRVGTIPPRLRGNRTSIMAQRDIRFLLPSSRISRKLEWSMPRAARVDQARHGRKNHDHDASAAGYAASDGMHQAAVSVRRHPGSSDSLLARCLRCLPPETQAQGTLVDLVSFE